MINLCRVQDTLQLNKLQHTIQYIMYFSGIPIFFSLHRGILCLICQRLVSAMLQTVQYYDTLLHIMLVCVWQELGSADVSIFPHISILMCLAAFCSFSLSLICTSHPHLLFYSLTLSHA